MAVIELVDGIGYHADDAMMTALKLKYQEIKNG